MRNLNQLDVGNKKGGKVWINGRSHVGFNSPYLTWLVNTENSMWSSNISNMNINLPFFSEFYRKSAFQGRQSKIVGM